MESCCFISNGEFLSGSDDGCVALWNTVRKKPVFIAHSVHGSKTEQHVAADMDSTERPVTAAVEAWVGAVAVCRNSDLAASGAGDGTVQLWELENSNSSLRALHKLPVVSFLLNTLPWVFWWLVLVMWFLFLTNFSSVVFLPCVVSPSSRMQQNVFGSLCANSKFLFIWSELINRFVFCSKFAGGVCKFLGLCT